MHMAACSYQHEKLRTTFSIDYVALANQALKIFEFTVEFRVFAFFQSPRSGPDSVKYLHWTIFSPALCYSEDKTAGNLKKNQFQNKYRSLQCTIQKGVVITETAQAATWHANTYFAEFVWSCGGRNFAALFGSMFISKSASFKMEPFLKKSPPATVIFRKHF